MNCGDYTERCLWRKLTRAVSNLKFRVSLSCSGSVPFLDSAAGSHRFEKTPFPKFCYGKVFAPLIGLWMIGRLLKCDNRGLSTDELNHHRVSPMKYAIRTIALLIVLLCVGSSVRAEIGIISPADANRLIESAEAGKKPIVLDTRGGYKDYFRGHLPRAHHLNFDTLRGTDRGVPVQYLPDDLTKALLVRAGVDRSRTHLIYATGDMLPNDEILSASMVAYVLEKFGVQEIRIVDGGLPGWRKAKLPVTQEYFGNPAGTLPEKGNPGIALTVEDVLKRKGQPGVVLVDARPFNEYIGEDDVWLRKGHIPGAISFHWARLMEKDNTHQFRSFEKTKADLKAAGLTPDREILVYCGTSREGSLLRFYLRHVAKYPNVRLYEGSWKEYASLKQYPAETKENKKQ